MLPVLLTAAQLRRSGKHCGAKRGVEDYRTVRYRRPRQVIAGDAVDSDFWDKPVIGGPLKLVLLAVPSHTGKVFALQQLKHRAFAGRIAAMTPCCTSAKKPATPLPTTRWRAWPGWARRQRCERVDA